MKCYYIKCWDVLVFCRPKDLNATPIESLPGNSSNKPQKACIPDIGVVRNENRTTQIGCVSPVS